MKKTKKSGNQTIRNRLSKKGMKSLSQISLKIIVMLFVAFIVFTSGAQAASKQNKTKKKAVKAYKTFLTKYRKKMKNTRFALVYIDNDSIPELYVYGQTKWKKYTEEENTYYSFTAEERLYRYSAGKIKMIHALDNSYSDVKSNKWQGDKSYDGHYYDIHRSYYKKTGVYRIDYAISGASSYVENFHYIKGKTLKDNKGLIYKWRIGKNNYELIEGQHRYEYSYVYPKNSDKGKKVSKEVLDKTIKKYTKGKKATDIKLRNNTAKNVKKYCK